MGLLLPRRRFELTTELESGDLRAALIRLLRRPPAPRRSSEPARYVLGDVGVREVVLQPAPRLDDSRGGATWWYRSIAEVAGEVEPRGSGSALVGDARVRPEAGDLLVLSMVGSSVAFGLFMLFAWIATGGASTEVVEWSRLAQVLVNVLVVAAAPFVLIRFMVQRLFDRDVAFLEDLVREGIAEAGGEGIGPRGEVPTGRT